jgi:D-threo-aldose 1-dehydrogenase
MQAFAFKKGHDMKKHAIGDTGLAVTDIGFGTAALGGMPDTYGHDVTEDNARATIHAIFDSPANLIDTSRNYGLGRSENRIGAVIRERGGLPDGFVLSTKLDRDMESQRFDADQVRRSVEESLEALGIDRFQILHLHDPEHARDLEEITGKGGALDALFQLKDEGLVQATGIAMGRTDILMPLVCDWPFDIVLNHNRFNPINRSAKPVFDAAAERGMAIFNAAPYAGGVLAKGSKNLRRITYQEASDQALAPVREIERLCAAHDIPPGAAALQFSTRSSGITSTLIGVSKPDRISETLDWYDTNIPEAFWDELAKLGYDEQDPEIDRVYVPG